MSDEPFLEISHVSKRFGAVDALVDVSLSLSSSDVVALVGANGAGKSTLLKVLAGDSTPDTGEILVDGRPTRIRNPADARAIGIEMVYQDLSLVDTLDAAGNIFLGRELIRYRIGRWLDLDRMRVTAAELFGRLAVDVDAARVVGDMSGGQRQAVALARAAYFETRVVILDEPTAALGVAETEAAISMIRRFRNEGASVVVASHDLESVFSFADRIIVMRHGHVVGAHDTHTVQSHEVIALMTVGGPPPPRADGSGAEEMKQ